MRSIGGFEREEDTEKRGRPNVLEGLELHRGILDIPEQRLLAATIDGWAEAGRQASGPLAVAASFRPVRAQHAPIHVQVSQSENAMLRCIWGTQCCCLHAHC